MSDEDELDPLDPLHKDSFIEGQEAVRADVTNRRLKERLKALGDLGEVAGETLTRIDQLAKDGDPHKKELADRLKAAIIGTVTGRPPAEERREPEQADPLPSGSPPSAAGLPGSTTKSLPPSGPPPTRKRGRPPKHPRS